jgi:hypothetical protein
MFQLFAEMPNRGRGPNATDAVSGDDFHLAVKLIFLKFGSVT